MKGRLLAALVVGTVLLLVGCQSFQAGFREAETKSRVVTIDASGAIEGDTLRVTGTATVPDGALVVWHASSVPADGIWTEENFAAFSGGVAEVSSGKFSSTANVRGWPGDDVKVQVAFQMTVAPPERQPPEVIELYGERGELMEGDVTSTGGYMRVKREFTVTR